MQTITIEIFTFDELPESAKERARDWYRAQGDCWHWQDEWWQSAQAFSEIAPIDIMGADYDRMEFDARWKNNCPDVRDLSGLRAWKWLQNNGWFDLANKNAMGDCTLTGYCGDCPLFDPIEQYATKPLDVPSLLELFRDCAYAWLKAARDDMEWHYSDECVGEYLEMNGYQFTSDGKFYQ
jgi:hypothetical protein